LWLQRHPERQTVATPANGVAACFQESSQLIANFHQGTASTSQFTDSFTKVFMLKRQPVATDYDQSIQRITEYFSQ